MNSASTTTQQQLTSTTAPGKTFTSRSELAEHYKSDWHKYNLKRREAGLPLLEESEFQTRWEAALALRQENDKKNKTAGTDHIKNTNKKKNAASQQKKKQNQQQQEQQKKSKKYQHKNNDSTNKMDVDNHNDDDGVVDEPNETTATATTTSKPSSNNIPAALAESQENPDIDPKQSLFDSHRSHTLKENVEYMQRNFGFFIPDSECLLDLEGLLGYCHEKIKLGHYCLYCEKMFPTWQGCQQHMINKQHTKLRYEQGHWEEFDPFYDFKKEDTGFLEGQNEVSSDENANMEVDGVINNNDGDGDDGDDGWEDISEGDDVNEGESNEIYEGFEKEIRRFGLDTTPLGELVFPDGRVVGHRALRRYYKQNLRTQESRTAAVIAAQEAAGERIYGGQVININQYNLKHENIKGAGKGILVPIKQDGGAGFSTLSLYRYQAAVRKQRRGDQKGQKLKERSFLNINRMDKKHNRLMNGVSVAHAAR